MAWSGVFFGNKRLFILFIQLGRGGVGGVEWGTVQLPELYRSGDIVFCRCRAQLVGFITSPTCYYHVVPV